MLKPGSYKLYEELQKKVLERGILTQEDIDRIARSPRREDQPGEPQEHRGLYEASFAGRRWYMVGLEYAEDHPLGGGMRESAGSEGAYEVAAMLTRRGSTNIPYVYVTDPNIMEGDSHLWLPGERREDGFVKVYSVVHRSHDADGTLFELVTNQNGRLGQIRNVLRGAPTITTKEQITGPTARARRYRSEPPRRPGSLPWWAISPRRLWPAAPVF